jgi:hypothetical protein
MRWTLPIARNILHSRTRLNANEKKDKSIVGSPTHFFQNLFDEKNDDATLCGRYNYEKKSKWIKKTLGNNIINPKNIFFIINIDNNHWACIAVYMEKKWIQYYYSLNGFGKDDKYVKHTLRYLKDSDKKKETHKT